MQNPVICCVGYNRPASMERLLRSIGDAQYDDHDILLVISIDESPQSNAVEAVARNFEWKYGEKVIKRYSERMGLKKHCLLCGDLAAEYGSVIFLEDDVVVAPGFYRYTKAAVEYYKNDRYVLGISLYAQKWVSDMNREFIPAYKGYDTFFLQRDISHGQCWIGDRWKMFREWYALHEDALPEYDRRVPPCVYNWDAKTSWSKYISFFMVEANVYYACPYSAYATNLSEVGVHARESTDVCQVPLSEGVNKQFHFGGFNESVIYDAIFERKDRFVDAVCGVAFEEICIDINAMKYDWSGYKYILTSRELPYEKLYSFGANMEPIENNVIYNVPGGAIRLYQIPKSYVPPHKPEEIVKPEINLEIMAHVLNKIPAKLLAQNLLCRVKKRLQNK